MTTPTAPAIPIMRPWIGEEEAEAAAAAVRSGWVAQGPRVAEFESLFADRVGAEQAVAVSNCTTALHLALIGAHAGRGDEVIVPSLSFIATTNAPRYVGATPVFGDVDLATGNLTVDSIATAITERTKAVIVVHQAGVPAEIDAIAAFCRKRDVVLIEDAACAIGSTYRDRAIGSHSDFVAFSFHPRKIVTTGEGGMLAIRDPEVAMRISRLREHGMNLSAAERHQAGGVTVESYLEAGFNYRMTDIQAAVGIVQLGKLDEMIARRRHLAARYHEGLDGLPGVTCVRDPAWGTTNYQSFWILLDPTRAGTRAAMMERLAEQHIATRRGIMAAHLEPACADITSPALPVTERITNDSLILPLYHEMSTSDQDRVIDAVRTELSVAVR